MKKALIIFLSLVLILSLAACGGGDGSKTPSDEARADENRYYGIGEAAESNGLSVTMHYYVGFVNVAPDLRFRYAVE